jgi:hypothetical protein
LRGGRPQEQRYGKTTVEERNKETNKPASGQRKLAGVSRLIRGWGIAARLVGAFISVHSHRNVEETPASLRWAARLFSLAFFHSNFSL